MIELAEYEYPKILIVSHNPFGLRASVGKTLSSIFTGWPKDRIAQLFFHNQVPDYSVCDNFYNVTEEQIILNKKEEVGKRVYNAEADIKLNDRKLDIRSVVKKSNFFSLMRSLIWESKKWDNANFNNWVNDFSPDLIFFIAGGSPFSYKIVNNISQTQGIPIYLYYMDDFILPINTINPFWWLNWVWKNYELKKILPKVSKIFTICEDMANIYRQKLSKECVSIMNSVDIQLFLSVSTIQDSTRHIGNSIKIAYFGGLHLNRWKTLSIIGKEIKNVSTQRNIDISISVYTNQQPEKKILEAITNPPYMEHVGSVNEDEIIFEMQKYDALIHVESFEKKYIEKTRLSISTKIPEYLSSGKPILAVGPKSISSIKYLEDTGVSYIIDSLNSNSISSVINRMVDERGKFENIGIKCIEIAKKNHSINQTRKLIKESLCYKMSKS